MKRVLAFLILFILMLQIPSFLVKVSSNITSGSGGSVGTQESISKLLLNSNQTSNGTCFGIQSSIAQSNEESSGNCTSDLQQNGVQTIPTGEEESEQSALNVTAALGSSSNSRSHKPLLAPPGGGGGGTPLQWPDLIVTNLYWHDYLSATINPTVTSGQPFNVFIEIRNMGDGGTGDDFDTLLSIDGVALATVDTGLMQAHTVTDVEIDNLFISAPGAHSLTATVDSGHWISESNGYGTAETNNDRSVSITVQKADWTTLIYFDFNNNLAAWESSELADITREGSSTSISLVVQLGEGFREFPAKHGYFSFSKQEFRSVTLQQLGQQDMSDPAVLTNFLIWGMDRFQADHYMVVLDDHGGSWLGCCWNDKPMGNKPLHYIVVDHLELADLGTTFSTVAAHLGRNIDVVWFDACLMSSIDVAYQLRNSVDYMTGSETIATTDSWNFSDVIPHFEANPTISPQNLATSLVDWANPYDDATVKCQSISAIDLRRMNGLAMWVKVLDEQLNPIQPFFAEVLKARLDSNSTEGPAANVFNDIIDLGEFCSNLVSDLPDSHVKTAAENILIQIGPAVDHVIMKEIHTAHADFCHGISIYFPVDTFHYRSLNKDLTFKYTNGNDYAYFDWYVDGNDFAAYVWSDFLMNFYSGYAYTEIHFDNPNSASIWSGNSCEVKFQYVGEWYGNVDYPQWLHTDYQINCSFSISIDNGATWQYVRSVSETNPEMWAYEDDFTLDSTAYNDSMTCMMKLDYQALLFSKPTAFSGTVYSDTFAIDNTPPVTKIIHAQGSSFISFGTEDSEPCTIYYSMDGGPFTEFPATRLRGLILPQPNLHAQFFEPFEHKIVAYSVDQAGNVGDNASLTLYYITIRTNYGSVTPSSGWYKWGSSFQIEATPPIVAGETFTFNGWVGEGTGSVSGSNEIITVGRFLGIRGPFTEIASWTASGTVEYTVLVDVNGSGTTNATGSNTYATGAIVAFHASPDAGCAFDGWLLNGVSSGSANPFVLTVDDNYNLTAVFAAIDAAPPSSSVSPLPDYETTNTFPVAYDAYDNGNGVANVQLWYRMGDSEPFIQFGVFTSSPVMFTANQDGMYEFYTVAKDANGNVEATPSSPYASTMVDTSPPSGSITINGGATYTTSSSVTLTLGFSDDSGSGVDQVRYCNDGSWANAQWEAPSNQKAWVLTLGDGVKTVYYQIMDNAGLLSNTYSATIVLDTAPPATSDNYDDQWHNVDFTITLTATDDIGSGVIAICYQINGGNTKTVGADGQPQITFESANNTLEYWSVDAAGNAETHHIITDIKLDKTAPTTQINVGNPQYLNFVSQSTQFTLSSTDAAGGSGVQSTFYFISNGTYNTVWTTYSSPFNLAGLTDGQWNISYYSTDYAGNAETAKNLTVILDNTPPTSTLTILGPAINYAGGWYVNSSTLFSLNEIDNTGGSGVASTTYRIYNAGYDSGWTPYTGSFYLPSARAGAVYTIAFNSTDNLGSIEATAYATVEVILHSVKVQITPASATVNPGQATKYSINVTNLGNVPDTYSLKMLLNDFGNLYKAYPTALQASWTSLSTSSWSLNPSQSGLATFTVTIPANWGGLQDATYTFNATATCQAAPTVLANTLASVTVKATKFGGATYAGLEVQWLQNSISTSAIPQTVKNGLLSTLGIATTTMNQALLLIKMGHTREAKIMLSAAQIVLDVFIFQVLMQQGRTIPPNTAQNLIQSAQRIQQELQTVKSLT